MHCSLHITSFVRTASAKAHNGDCLNFTLDLFCQGRSLLRSEVAATIVKAERTNRIYELKPLAGDRQQ